MSESWTRPCATLTVADGDVVVIEARGELDSSNVDVFRQALTAAPGPGGTVLDLSGVAFIDSAGLGAVIGAVRRSREEGSPVAIVVVRNHVTDLFKMVGINRIAPVLATRQEALTSVRSAVLAESAPPGMAI